MKHDLCLVMPVYNEEACVKDVVLSWRRAFEALDISFLMLILNDGSKDNTAEELKAFDDDKNVQVINKTNSGHGPTILEGYRQAAQQAHWVFQCDSDDEMPAESFASLWQKRENYDVLFGVRTNREQDWGRQILSAGSRMAVRLLYGRGIEDVNTPYRLMRAEILAVLGAQMPDDTFAPNVILSGAFARAGLRIANLPVEHINRRTGVVSVAGLKVLRVAMQSFIQTIRCRSMVRWPGDPQ